MKLEFDTKLYIENLRKDKNNYFHTFINRETLAAGIIVLQPGQEDTQSPHESDEMYYVLKGDGYLKINQKDYPISGGKSFFVQKDVEHYFFGNKKSLLCYTFLVGQILRKLLFSCLKF